MKEPKRSSSEEIKSKTTIERVSKGTTQRRMEIRKMSRLAFKEWCQKYLKRNRLQFVLEETSEHDSWEYISQRGQTNKESSKWMMQLKQLKFSSIQSG